ncbi:hypothetical protein QZH41_016781 [Actinostola sp. cb2023]|nr:hypothetical protein QZH41_016781 [Actinostola sp. cb2023]
MAPFRWPSMTNDIMLATEVSSRKPKTSSEWEQVASILSLAFSTSEKPVELTGRACRERLDRLVNKYKVEDKKSLKRSGSEEEYTELQQILEDICTFRRDQAELKQKEKQNKKKKEKEDIQKGLEMRAAALSGMHSKCYTSTINCSKRKVKQRASKLTALEMLAEKYQQKSELKDKELELRRMELQFQKEKFEAEAKEREAKLQLELEERRFMVYLMKNRM